MLNQMLYKSAEEARRELSNLLAAAEQGRGTIITRYGRPVAALIPIAAYSAAVRQPSLLPLQGSGRGLWGESSTATIQKLMEPLERARVTPAQAADL